MNPGQSPQHSSRAFGMSFQQTARQAPARSSGHPGASARDNYQAPAPRGDESIPVSDTAISQADGEA